MALTNLATKLDVPGPVFFVRQRVGLRKHLFPAAVWKLDGAR